MGGNLGILRSGLLLVGIPFLAQILFLVVLAQSRAEQLRAQFWALHTKEVIAEADGLFLGVVEVQAAVRGAVLSGDPADRAAYDRARREVPGRAARLVERVADNPPQQAKARAVGDRAAELLGFLAGVDQQARDGRRDEAAAAVRAGEGRRRLDQLRAELDDFLQEEERLDKSRVADLTRAQTRQTWALAAGGSLAVLSTGLLLWLFTRGFGRRLQTLRDNARRLADGKPLAARLAGTDELAQLDRVFHDMAASIAQKDRENEMFVYSVSHDLRSPLVNLQGFSQELAAVAGDLRGLLADNPDVPATTRDTGLRMIDRDMAEAVRFIQTAVARLSGIIDSLLRLSRVGKVEYRPQEVDVRVVATRVADALRGTATQRKAEIAVGPLPGCYGDPAAVEQIFANLVGNAVNYLDPARPGRVEVGGGDLGPDGLRVYHVRDNGRGIPADHLPKVFGAFKRLHPDAAPGEGIGLALVRRVVERHAGRVWVESEHGVGTTFFVALPAAADPAAR